ncbi:MAG: hydroxymethylbilane synthase [Holosporales bacterium]
MKHVRIGTRASPLARKQAEMVADCLKNVCPDVTVEVITMTTTGDLIHHERLTEWGGKGLFTKEIEEALLQCRVDLAVHSMKDVATILPEGLIIPSYLPREDARDIWLSRDGISLDALPKGSRVGTSSLRRQAQVLALRPDVQVVTLRGNVNTRLKKLADGHAEATLLAAAGLKRLGLQPDHAMPLSIESFVPAVAQGVIGLQCRVADTQMQEILAGLNHGPTAQVVEIERTFLQAIDGSCRTPIAAHAILTPAGMIDFHAFVATVDGTKTLQKRGEFAPDQALEEAHTWGQEMKTWLQAHQSGS